MVDEQFNHFTALWIRVSHYQRAYVVRTIVLADFPLIDSI